MDMDRRHQKAFNDLRDRVTSEPVLAHPELDKPFELEVDASGFAVGAVLLQKKEDGKRHPIAYFSKTLNEAQRNYDVADLELLAVVMSLDNWRSFLAGSPHKVIVYSDHQNLLYWKEPHKISRRVAREVLRLSEYNIEIRHIKGTANGRADALSRRPDYDQGTEDNTNVVVLPDRLFARTTMTMTQQHRQDEERLKPWVDPHQLKCLNGTWYKEGRVVVTERFGGQAQYHQGAPRSASTWTPRYQQNGTTSGAKLLVATNAQRHNRLRSRMRRLSAPQSQQPSDQGTTQTHLPKTRSYAFRNYSFRFHH
jgi:hypothetical protein